MENINWIEILNSIFLIYGIILFLMYLFNAVLSILELRAYTNRNKYVDYKSMLAFEKLPAVSVVAPAFNEEKTIIDNVRCLLSLLYQNFEIIIVNDGSTDNTLQTVISHFDMIQVNRVYEAQLVTAPVRAIYQSQNPAYNHLFVIDKDNGGKADALNAGINFASNELFLGIDVDSVIEPDALLKMVKPFIDNRDKVVIASGGVIRIANSCEIQQGKITRVKYPSHFWAKFQVLEYFRAFTLGRMAWSRLNGLLIISGAFGLFDRQRVINIGGYDSNTVGEDLELVVRLRRYMYEVEKVKYRVAFIPDPLCWTEVPEKLGLLRRQRNRWTRGAIDTILKHRKMFLNPNYGLIGMVSFPYWVIFEWLGPIIEAVGLVYFFFLLYYNMVNFHVFFSLLIFVLAFSFMYSLFAVFYEAYTYNKYKGVSYISQTVLFIILEMFIYQPLNMIFSLGGHLDYYFRKKDKKEWGMMQRKGFHADDK